MANVKEILGVNSRNRLYLSYNSEFGRRLADSKLLTKRKLIKAGIPTPQLLTVLKKPSDVYTFSWQNLPGNFVLKPCSGFGGGGIIIVKRRAKVANEWYLMEDSLISTSNLQFQALDILAGQYSFHNLPDCALIEERIKVHKLFKKYAYHGTPDIRIIVFNKVPVAAMLRLPTPESHGKANLHQGAIGVGIDLATGITTYGVHEGQFIKNIPWTKRKINGLKIPNWNQILTLAVRCQEAIPSLGYLGVDIVFDKEHGPMVLELNARPGLEIQNANLLPLRKRLERVEGLEVLDAEHGVRIAKALFAERFADRVMAEEGIKIINSQEEIKIRDFGGKRIAAIARIDSGAFRSSIDQHLAENLGLLKEENVLWKDLYAYRSAQGKESRPVIGLTFYLAGRRIKTTASVADRSKLKCPFLVGRNDLAGFLIRP